MKSYFVYPKDICKRIQELKTKDPAIWEKMGKRVFDAFIPFVVQTVPAYKKFLKQQGIQSAHIGGLHDIQKLPIIDKENYLRAFSYEELFSHKNFKDSTTVSATSGSTGEPFYFPRSDMHDSQYEYTAEIFLRNQFDVEKKSTVGIIGFGLGIWIGGIFTYKTFNRIASRLKSFTLVPIGPSKDLFLRTVKKFQHTHDQLILMGYPPFIKDIIDHAPAYGINWEKGRVKILTAAEGFTESFRGYIAKKTGIKNPLQDILNIYGTVELGTMAHETSFANLIRKIAVEKKDMFKEIFPLAHRTPTLAQYHPYLVHFEEQGGEILATGYGSSIPLIRYRFPDLGGVLSYDQMLEKLKGCGIDIQKEAKKAGIEKQILKLPFVYVYERSDFSVTFVGINLYPDYVRSAIQHKNVFHHLSGKFSMEISYDSKHNQFLHVHIELQKNKGKNTFLQKELEKRITEVLLRCSTEYYHLYTSGVQSYKDQLTPRVFLWEYEHPRYFKGGGKHRWTIAAL
ncbi:MAG: hypothetical protein UU76_C0028G0005 [Parcubacteria group bacterium GW2011_GWC1_41_7]|nr:MAG: hypothetical protein UU76_C0028G0005 [Parcubacteria group bacterium GW2011_GWC1_41_7]